MTPLISAACLVVKLFLYGVLVILTVQLLTGRINMDFSVGRTRAGRNPSVPRASSYWC